MNREIIFRGKSSDNDEWVQGYLHKKRNFIGENYYIDCLKYGHIGKYNTIECVTEMVEPETVGEYTGLNDKNGTKIFEGDIVKTQGGYNMGVFWHDEFTGFYLKNEKLDSTHFFGEAVEPCQCEVVGNIHDNKELLDKS